MGLCLLGLQVLTLPLIAQSGEADPREKLLDIGSDRQLFVDHYLIDSLNGVALRLHEPQDKGPVLHFDRPWEGRFSGYCTVIKEDSLFRAYYRGLPVSGRDGSLNEVSCYAESNDGINWRKPALQLYERDGSRANNIILADAAPVTHNFSPFLDARPNILPGERYKALGGTAESGLIAYRSADGIHWEKMQEEPVLTEGMFDSQNVAFWSEAENQYVAYFRIWTGTGYAGFRSVGRATSDDFIHWTATRPMTFGETPLQHLYTNQTHPYFRAPQIYIAIAARFMPNRQVVDEASAEQLGVNPKYYKDCSDAVFMTSRGGNTYDRTFMESFIRPGIGLENWVSRTNYPALNVLQTGPTEMSIYVNQDYAQPSAHLRRYTLRLDGFASASAPFTGGELITKPLIFSGSKLFLNFSTSAAGSIKVYVLDAGAGPDRGKVLASSAETIGNEIEREVIWQDADAIRQLTDKPVRLKFVIQDADLFAFRFGH